MYDVLLIDPPWPVRKGGKRSVRPKQGRTLDYNTMSVRDNFLLLDREVFPLAMPTHTVFLWGVDRYLLFGEEEMLRRGYRLHTRIIWDKTNGIAPAFSLRFSHEFLSWFYRPRFTPVAKEFRGKFTTVIREAGREHSRKPDAAYTLISTLYPTATKLDVFSRERRDGWDQFGDQKERF